jgi:hypothetical protein
MSWAPESIHIDSWPAIYALLAPALELAGEAPHELIDLLIANHNQLWVNREGGDPIAAAVSELEPTPYGVCLHVRLLGGKSIARWIAEAVQTIAQHARSQGVTKVRVEVIPALERVLREHGFKRSKVAMDLPITMVPA